jgi:competence protein ComEA
MRRGRGSEERRAAVERRLALLGDELAVLHEPVPADEHTHTRIRPAPEAPAESDWAPAVAERPPTRRGSGADPENLAPVIAVPTPGRHAARRSRLRPLPGLLGPGQLAVLAVGVAVSLAVACWWLLRSEAEPVPLASGASVPLVTPADGSSPAVSSAPMSSPGADPAEIVVDVAGRVRHPGIRVLKPGARVVDALKAAGGARRGVDLTPLNLARLLVDGEQILVGTTAAPQPASAPAASGAGLLVNINTADQTELESLPEVGPVTAAAIIAWREENGGFSSVDQLVEVDGIGEATLNTVSPFVTV